MGKRTKFQSFDLAQLVLLARSESIDDVDTPQSPLPQQVENPDPDAPAMAHVTFTEALPDAESTLSVLDQCIVLALWSASSPPPLVRAELTYALVLI